MKSIFSLLLVLLIYSCNSQTKKSKISTDIFYYTGVKNFRIDTFNLSMLPFHEKRDSLITKGEFELFERKHQIRMYTHISGATDEDNLLFEIDSIGIFYSRSINWPSYSRLKSNNDSINILIDFALENILMDERMRCYSYFPPSLRP